MNRVSVTETEMPLQMRDAYRHMPWPAKRGFRSNLGQLGASTGRVGTSTSAAVQQVGEIFDLFLQVAGSAIRHPRGYWGNVRAEMYDIIKRCWIPVLVSVAAFAADGPGVCGGNLYQIFGMPHRLGSFLNMASLREIAPFVNMMVVAGVAGSAYTADLGARRIREEIDAMEVLGVDPVREIILPRVIACMIVTGLLDILGCVAGVLGGGVIAWRLGGTWEAFSASFWASASPVEVWSSPVKSLLYGLIIGIICCYKGYHARGGAVGVGRAVNQAVVITFCVVWIFHYTITTVILGLHPEMSAYR